MIVTEADMPKIRALHKGKKIVFTGGTFDIIHHGHRALLQAGRKMGDILVVSIASDVEVRARKGPTRPLHGQDERARNVDDLHIAEYIVVRANTTSLTESMMHTARLLQPDILFYGPDVTRDVVLQSQRELGHNRVVVDCQPKVTSTTQIIRQMSALAE